MADTVSVIKKDHQRVDELFEQDGDVQDASTQESPDRRWMPFLALLGLLAACEDQGNPGDDSLLTGGSLVVLIVVAIVIFLVIRRRR
jgi:hypothetical protein